jgi:hypothetical protein
LELAKGTSVLGELGQAAGQVQATGVILAVAALSKALYPYFSRWLDHRERMHEPRPPPRPELEPPSASR